MAKLGINTGSTPNDGTGDTLLAAALKINQNFTEIYTTLGDGSNLSGVVTSLVGYATEGYVDNAIVGFVTTGALSGYATEGYVDNAIVGIVTSGALSGYATEGYVDNAILGIGTGIGGGGESYWTSTAAGIHTLSNVGIGTNNPKGRFQVGYASTNTNEFIITSSGDVGIGTTNPEHFDGFGVLTLDGKDYQYLGDTLSGGGNIIFKSKGIKTLDIYAYTDNISGISTATNIDLHYGLYVQQPSGSNIVSLTKSGNVGIGTTNPTSALTVVGSGTSTSQLYVTGVSTFRNHIKLGTDDYFYLGDTNQYYLQYNGSSGSRLYSNTTFTLLSDRTIIKNKADLEYMIDCVADAEVALYYNGSKKFETLGTGVTVTGTTFTNQLSVSGVSTFNSTLNGLYLNNATNVKGTSNIAIGENALLNHTFGNNSIAIGYDSLRNASNPNFHNIGIGQYAGRSLTNGVLNTFLGYNSGYDMTGGSGNVIIGSFNGNAYGLDIRDADDYIILSANGQSSTEPRLVIEPSGNVGVGTTNPGYYLDGGSYGTNLSTTNLTVGSVGTSGTSLLVNGEAIIDGMDIHSGTSGPLWNAYFGYKAGRSSAGGNLNAAFGPYAFYNNVNGNWNAAFGNAALQNSTGNENSAFGSNAGSSITGGQGNTLIGRASGNSITNGSSNTFLGSYSGNQTTGSGNLFLGYYAGQVVTSGEKNVIIGSFNGSNGSSGLDIRTSSNNIVLSDGDANVRLYANSSGNIGIGTTNPTVKLEVNGSVRVGVDTSAGVILTSPNGTKYQLFVENDGTLKTVAV